MRLWGRGCVHGETCKVLPLIHFLELLLQYLLRQACLTFTEHLRDLRAWRA